MTFRPMLALAVVCVVSALTACSDDAPSGPNPPRLWLALDGSEVQVRLVAVEPPPF